MAQDPAILFYTADFIIGTMLMSDDQVGKYIKLLCLQHQHGSLSQEDMLKICQTHDIDIFSKFKVNESGRYFNERMQSEMNKRINYSNSRKANRLSKKHVKNEDSHVNHVSDTSSTHVGHMENENTINNTIDNKGNSKVDNKILNNGGGKHVSDICSTHVGHMSEGRDFAYAQKDYRIVSANEGLQHPLEVCTFNYFNNELYDGPRKLHIIRLKLSDDPEKANEILKRWAEAFNRCQISGGVTAMAMAGMGQNTYVKYLPNWINSVVGDKKNINPDKLYTSEHNENQNVKSQRVDKKTTKRKLPGADATPEEWNAYYDGK